jgi:predicted small secreted protein
MIKTLKISALLAVALSLGACNTIAGLGQDLQNLGRTIDKGASSNNTNKDSDSSGVVVTPVK